MYIFENLWISRKGLYSLTHNMREEGRWSRGMIPRLQRGDQEFESPPAHL
jgi:hypothetical protein